jgi:VWFA-related protein
MRRERLILLILIAVSGAAIHTGIAAQTPAKSTAQEKSFGSSLMRPQRDSVERPDAGKGQGRSNDSGNAEDTVTVNTRLAVFDVLVTDATGSRFINGLGKDDFIAVEDDKPQQVTMFALGDDAKKLPRSIILIFDRSASLLPYLDASVEAAKKLIDRLAPTDQMAIVTDDVELALGFTSDKKLLKSKIESLKKRTEAGAQGGSRQFSALLATLRELVDEKRGRPIIIFQTDGDEATFLTPRGTQGTGSSTANEPYDISDVFSEIEGSRAKIYSIIPGGKIVGLSSEEAMRRGRQDIEKAQGAWNRRYESQGRKNQGQALPDVVVEAYVEKRAKGQETSMRAAETSGGWYTFLETPSQAAEIYEHILADINHHYIIGYYPTDNEPSERERKVRIEVRNHPEYVVHGRKSYYLR